MARSSGYHAPLPVRFWARVDMSGGLLACWPWQGALSTKRAGTQRGHIRSGVALGRRWLLAHRTALWLAEDPEALDITIYLREDVEACHVPECNNRICCNPAHLYWGTPDQNRADRYPSVRERLAAMAAETLGADAVPF